MKIAIIGTTSYINKMKDYKEMLEKQGHEARIPALDDRPELNEIGICEHNLENIKWADRVDVFWDKRSMGTIFDFGMTFALNKPFKRVFMEPKTFMAVMEQYENRFNDG